MTFSVVSYNILADAHIKPERYTHCEVEALDPGGRRRLLLDTIAGLDADIYCLQEVERGAFDDVQSLLGVDDFLGFIAIKCGKSDGAAIFVRRSAFEDVRPSTLHYAVDASAQLALIVEAEARGERVVVANTHLQWEPPSTAQSVHKGRAQLVELMDSFSEHGDPGGAWIVAGDFNAEPDSCVVSAARARGLEMSSKGHTTNIQGRCRKIDFILHTDHLVSRPRPLSALSAETVMPSAVHASDHLPLQVDFNRR